MSSAVCYRCKGAKELRPYGPAGELVCFACAFATPEAKAETEKNFGRLLDGAGPIAILTESGPQPLGGKRRGQA